MRVQFRKLDPNKLDEIPEHVQILFVQEMRQGRGVIYLETYVGSIHAAKIWREYQLNNSWTHWLILPKITHKK